MSIIPVYLTPTVGALNIRSGPGAEHGVADVVRAGESLGLLEPLVDALDKLGDHGAWINIRTPSGRDGFAAAWFLQLKTTEFILTPTGIGLRVRNKPRTGLRVASVNPGDKLKALQRPETVAANLGVTGKWLHVRLASGIKGWVAAWYLDWHTADVEPERPSEEPTYTGEPWPFGRCLRGIHDRAERHPQPADHTIAAGRFEAVKVVTGARPHEVQGYQPQFTLCRLFESWGNRELTAEDFVNAVVPDMEPLVNVGVTYFEFHNEPNLTSEGLKAAGFNGSWEDGAGFARFFLRGYTLLKSRFPNIKLGFPGLSPGGDTFYQFGHDSGWRMSHGRFLDGAEPALARADFIALHTYYADWDELNGSTIDLVRKYRQRWPDKLLFVTEFGNGSKTVSPTEKGRQIKHFYQLCNQIPGVGAAFYYIVSGSGWEHWALRNEDGSSTGIVEAMA